ncbi:MAG: hypothetical protein NTX86_00725 [Candidatus Dependentiae bacterium]|nr:hypothetical protein [Candidatus Dependentiae bacterium]
MEFRLGYFATLQAQSIFLVLSVMTLVYLFYKPVITFEPVSKESFVLPLTPEVVKQWGKEPVHVKTGFMFHQFLTFNVTKNEFLMTAVIWFEFDPTKVSLETIGKFSFTKGEIKEKSEPVVTKISDTLSFVRYHVRVQFNTILDYRMFPLNDHIISLNFTNTAVNANEVVFDVAPADFVVPQYLSVSGWDIVSHEAKSGFTDYELSQEKRMVIEPKVVFSFGIQKKDVRQLILMLLPILILFYLSIFMLSVYDYLLKMQNAFMVFTAYMAYNVVIQAMSPDVGYFMLIDYLVLLFLVAMFIIFLALVFGELPPELLAKDTYEDIKGGVVLFVHAMVIGTVFYLTHYLV